MNYNLGIRWLNKSLNQFKVAYVTSLSFQHSRRGQDYSSRASSTTVYTLPKEPSLMRKWLDKLKHNTIEKSKMSYTGYLLYESIADKINYSELFRILSLPDTYYSWFVITELHIWMLTTRLMSEDKGGEFLRNRVFAALWRDAQVRTKKLGQVSSVVSRNNLIELSEQLNAALIAYDEGVQSTDTVLASALWRRLYQQKQVHPENLDVLVKYVRKQVQMLDNLTKEEICSQRTIAWEKIQSNS